MKNILIICSMFLALSAVITSPVGAQFLQQGLKLVGTGAVGTTLQGQSVSISSDGNTAIVGGYNDNSGAGAVWVFTRSGSVWTQQGSKLVGTGAAGSDVNQGYSVALSGDGNTAIVGGDGDNNGAGAAWVYARSSAVWTQQGTKLVGTGASGTAAYQGTSVSLSADGNTAAVGGNWDSSSFGAVWIFTRSGGVWTQQGSKLVGTGAAGNAHQGTSVSLSADGNTLLVGGYNDNGNIGAAWAFTRSYGVWTQQGTKLVGLGAIGSAREGQSVSISSDGNTAIVGGYNDNDSTGAAWVYTRSGSVWTQQGSKLVGAGAVGRAQQGYSVSLSADGNTAILGGFTDNSDTGAAWVYTRSGSVWTQQGSKLVGTGSVAYAYQGFSVALSADGTTAIVCGYGDNSLKGAAWVYSVPGSPIISSISDIPDDQGGQVRLNWNKSPYDNPLSYPQVSSYAVFRQSPAGPSMAAKAPRVPEGIVMDSSLLGYDYVTTIPAFQLPYYKTVVPTLEDSTSTGDHYFLFKVVAQTGDLNQYYASGVDSGYSVDNLSPIPPQNATILPLANGPINIHWNPDRTDPDVGHFTVYRSTTSGFSVNSGTRLRTSVDTTVTDSTAQVGQQYYYRVTTVDIHGNESQPTAELSSTALAIQLASMTASTLATGVQIQWTTVSETNSLGFYVERKAQNAAEYATVSDLIPGAGTSLQEHQYQWTDTKVTDGNYSYRLRLVDLSGTNTYSNAIAVTVSGVTGVNGSLPAEFALQQNYPNPFNPSTVINYELPKAVYVRLVVYDMLGREVATLINGTQDAGYKSVEFSAENLPSGIYAYRLTAGTFVEVKKMALLK